MRSAPTLKKPNGARPRARRVSSTIMFGDDAIRVIMPLISAATDNGISIHLRFRPVILAIAMTTGMNMATIAHGSVKTLRHWGAEACYMAIPILAEELESK